MTHDAAEPAPHRSEEAGEDVLATAHRARLLQAGEMLAGIVHEIKNPLAVIHGYAQLLQERATDDADRQDVEQILLESRRMGALIEDMLSFLRHGADIVERVDLHRVVQSAVRLSTHAMRQARITVVASQGEEPLWVRGQPAAFVQVVLNLLSNARDSLKQVEGSRGVAIHDELLEGGERVALVVSNNGPAIPPAVAERIFDRFFTTKGEGEGTGLGLALCRDILRRYDGTITLERSDADGVAFRLELPRA